MAGCLSGDAGTPSGCAAVRAMRDVGRIAVSPDGKNVYVPSRDADAVVAFHRNGATGALTQKSTIAGCYTTDASVVADDGCSLASGTAADLDGPTAVAISPTARTCTRSRRRATSPASTARATAA